MQSKPGYKNVAVPEEVYHMIKELAVLEERSIARELSSLIREAHHQLIGTRVIPGGP